MKVAKWQLAAVVAAAVAAAFLVGLQFHWIVANFPVDEFRMDLDDVGHVFAWAVGVYFTNKKLTRVEAKNGQLEQEERDDAHAIGRIVEDLKRIEERLEQLSNP